MNKKELERELMEGIDRVYKIDREEEVMHAGVDDVGLEDFVGAIYAELVELKELLKEFMECFRDASFAVPCSDGEVKMKEDVKKPAAGFRVGADSMAGRGVSAAASPIAKAFGNL